MSATNRAGPVYWIDHYIVCTNDLPRWQAFHSHVLGAVDSLPSPAVRHLGMFQTFTAGRHGGFKARGPLPQTRGLGKGLPRYGFYVEAKDIESHLRRLDDAKAVRSEPTRIMSEGEAGTVIYWQDPDGNQFEFWAPDKLPAGAMDGCNELRVGRISHGVFESRDFDLTAAFFDRYCSLTPMRNKDIAVDTLVLPLKVGGRIIFKKVSELEGRTAGCGLPDAHTALLVHDADFFENYMRMWTELPEWDFDVSAGNEIVNPGGLPPRTVLHVSWGGRLFKERTSRGDDFFDHDTNMFHFYGATPIHDDMATYDGHTIDYYVDRWEEYAKKLKDGKAPVFTI